MARDYVDSAFGFSTMLENKHSIGDQFFTKIRRVWNDVVAMALREGDAKISRALFLRSTLCSDPCVFLDALFQNHTPCMVFHASNLL